VGIQAREMNVNNNLVEIAGAPPTEALASEGVVLEINGKIGFASWFDEQAGKYAVQLLEDQQYVMVSREHLRPASPPSPSDGGFDLFWGGDTMSLNDLGYQVMDKLMAKGWCLVACPRTTTVRKAAMNQANNMKGFFTPKTELLADYMGKGGSGKVCFLEEPTLDADALTDGAPQEEVTEDVLGAFEDGMDLICQEMAKYTPEVLGFDSVGRRKVFAWMPYSDRAESKRMSSEPLKEEDVEEGLVEEHLNFIRHRRVGLLWMVSNEGGELQMLPSADYEDLESVKIPLTANKLLIYRSDLMTYSYKPKTLTESLVLQTWLLEAAPKISTTSLVGDSDMVSKAQGIMNGLSQPVGKRLNIAAMHGKFPSVYCYEDMLYMCCAGTDVFIGFPETRFDKSIYCIDYDSYDARLGKSYVWHSSMMPDHDTFNFDNDFFNIGKDDVQYMSPSHRLTLEVAYGTLVMSGRNRQTMHGANIGFFIGDTGSDFSGMSNSNRLIDDQTKAEDGNILPPFSSLSLAGGSQCITATRFSYCVGLKGPTSQVDTACSASLIAFVMGAGDARGYHRDQGDVHVARHTEEALCGGVSVQVGPFSFISLCAGTMLSKDGRCKTFNHTANGYARGEASSFGLMRYSGDEETTQNRLACLVGLAANQDGRSANLTAPSGPAQQACIRQSMKEAGLTARQICIAECHGTGTALGDPIEVGALRGVMEPRDTNLGSTSSKSHIGHMEACAGVVGLWKCIIMMECSLGTPNVHLAELNSHLEVHGYPVQFHTEFYNTDVNAGVAGVSSFGFGGTNGRSDVYGQCRKGPNKTGQDFIDIEKKIAKRVLFKVQCPVTLGAIDYLTGEPIESLIADKNYYRADVLRDVMAPYDVSRHAYLGGYRFQAREPADYGEADLLPESKLYICGSWTGYQKMEEMQRMGRCWYGTSFTLGEGRCENFFFCLDEDREMKRIFPEVNNATPFIHINGPDEDDDLRTWRIDGRDLQVPEGTKYKIVFKWGLLHKEIRWEEAEADYMIPKEPVVPFVHTYFCVSSFNSWNPQAMTPVPDEPGTWEILGRFGVSGFEEFKFLRDGVWEQAIYPANPHTKSTGVPVRGPDEMGSTKNWVVEGTVSEQIRLRLSVKDAHVVVTADVIGSGSPKVWESVEGWDRHMYYAVGTFGTLPMMMDPEKAGVFTCRINLGSNVNNSFGKFSEEFQIWVDNDSQQAYYPMKEMQQVCFAPNATHITFGPDANGISPKKCWQITSQAATVIQIEFDMLTADRRRTVTWYPVPEETFALEE